MRARGQDGQVSVTAPFFDLVYQLLDHCLWIARKIGPIGDDAELVRD
jgi:hypothetical protein